MFAAISALNVSVMSFAVNSGNLISLSGDFAATSSCLAPAAANVPEPAVLDKSVYLQKAN